MKLTFRLGYALAALALLLVEVAIALWVKDRFIRPYGGDILATILVYLALRAVTGLRIMPAIFVALGVSFMVEVTQALGLVARLGLTHHAAARTLLGTSFAVEDLVAYTAGAIFVLVAEQMRGADTLPEEKIADKS